MSRLLSSFVFAALTHSANAADLNSDPLVLVPGGTVVAVKHLESIVQTPAGSLVELDFRGNQLDEASGHAAGRGDVLVPGGGLLTLDQVLAIAVPAGGIVESWSLETEGAFGWVYELDIIAAGSKRERHFSAVDGSELFGVD